MTSFDKLDITFQDNCVTGLLQPLELICDEFSDNTMQFHKNKLNFVKLLEIIIFALAVELSEFVHCVAFLLLKLLKHQMDSLQWNQEILILIRKLNFLVFSIWESVC